MTTLNRIIEHPSPNFTERRGGAVPDMVVLHYTGMESAQAALERLCDPVAEVSAHYLITETGQVFRLVAEDKRAWHAGAARWGGVEDVNSRSIGVELANPGHALGYPPFPAPQMAALEGLLDGVLARWRIPPERVVGHAEVAPGRKIDPGEKFDWRRLARAGLAVWLDWEDRGAVADPDPDSIADAFATLARRIGYAVPEPAQGLDFDAGVGEVWRAVAMRWMPEKVGRPAPDAHDLRHLARVAETWPVC